MKNDAHKLGKLSCNILCWSSAHKI